MRNAIRRRSLQVLLQGLTAAFFLVAEGGVTGQALAGGLYWSNLQPGQVRRATLNGSSAEVLFESVDQISGVALDIGAGKIYWGHNSMSLIRRANLDGSEVEDFLSSPDVSSPLGLALDDMNGKLYWADPFSNKVQRANLDGSGVEEVFSNIGIRPWGIALDAAAGQIYLTDNYSGGRIWRVATSGANPVALVQGLSFPVGIALDLPAGRMYWADPQAGRVQRANLDGTEVQDIFVAPKSGPRGVAVNSTVGKLYWSDFSGTGIIYRANRDGTQVEALLVGVGAATFISLDTRPEVGDCDGDELFTLGDLGAFDGCLSGPDEPYAPGCECADADGDGDVDLNDHALIMSMLAACNLDTADCNANIIPDACDILVGRSLDCNATEVPDECEVSSGSSSDCDANEVPDECDPDCNSSGYPDACDIASGTSADSDGDSVPDECRIWYVDDDGPGDPAPGDPLTSDPQEDGTPDHPFDAIQEALNIAAASSEIIVADGLYRGVGNKHLDLAGKALTLRSENGPTNCIIDCEDEGRAFHFHSGETRDSVVEGLTMTRGWTQGGSENGGAGVYCRQSSPTLRNCVITANTGFDYGAGVRCDLSSNPLIIGCTIVANRSYSGGGGIACVDDSDASIIGCLLEDNLSNNGGGGIFCDWSNPSIASCIIRSNDTAGDGGGGIFCVASSPTISNVLISDNSVTYANGGGIFCVANSHALVFDCTLVGNSAIKGGGMAANFSSSPHITNSIVWGNTAMEAGPQFSITSTANPSTISVAHCDVQGGQAAASVEAGCTLIWLTGNFVDDPLFRGPTDFRLSAGSPCIDAGNNSEVPSGILTDLYGNPRFVDVPTAPDIGSGMPPVVDMGVHEHPVDCNDNDIPDSLDLAAGSSLDCNADAIPDECQGDCNTNGVPDDCDITGGTSTDCNGNGAPDECELDQQVSALRFDGSDDRVTIPDAMALSPATTAGQMTIEAWVRLHGYPVSAQNRAPVFAKGGNSQWEYALSILTNGQVALNVWNLAGSNLAAVAGGTVPLNSWHHVAATYSAGSAVTVYIDGIQAATAAASATTPSNGASPGWIGARPDGAQYLPAEVGDLRLWSIARTPVQISDNTMARLMGTETGLVGLWRFEEDTADQAVLDSTPSGPDGSRGTATSPDAADPPRLAGSRDCNSNGVPDTCDLAAGTSQDGNGNGVPDECQGG